MLTYMLTFVNLIMLSSILNNFIDYIKYLRLRLKILQIEMKLFIQEIHQKFQKLFQNS